MNYSHLTKEQVIDGIRKGFPDLYTLSAEQKDDKDIVLTAVSQDTKALYYASKRLKDDKQIVIETVKKDPWVLEIISERLKNDKEIVLEAVKNYGLALAYASDDLQNDKELLEILEKTDASYLNIFNMNWRTERMEVLKNIREKEFMENSLTKSNKDAKKIKF